MVYQDFKNRVAVLTKRELTLNLAKKPPCWKPTESLESILEILLKMDASSEFFFDWFYKIASSKISKSFIWDFFVFPLLRKFQSFNL